MSGEFESRFRMSPHLEMDRYNRNLFFIFSFGLCYNWLRGLYFIEESKSVPAEILSGERSLVETRSCPEFMLRGYFLNPWDYSPFGTLVTSWLGVLVTVLVLDFTPGSLQDLCY